MKPLAIVASLACALAAYGQVPAPLPDWKDFAPLVGEWTADQPTPADPRGGFVLEPSLGGRVLVRRNWAEYPATKDRPSARHDDLLIIYREGTNTRADYYDNEGHAIRYAVTNPAPGTVVFTSEPRDGQPRFRLTNAVDASGVLAIRFEIAPPGAPEGFKPYITATAHRKK